MGSTDIMHRLSAFWVHFYLYVSYEMPSRVYTNNQTSKRLPRSKYVIDVTKNATDLTIQRAT